MPALRGGGGALGKGGQRKAEGGLGDGGAADAAEVVEEDFA